MRTKFITLIMAACCLAAVSSCSNAEIEEKGKADANGLTELSVKGVLGEFKTEETKSSLVNSLRVGWANDDKVLVFHKESKKYLGVLTAAIIGTDDRTAMLSGTITAPSGEGKTLVFVHGTGLQATDFTVGASTVTLDLSAQGEKTPFMVYGTAPYIEAGIKDVIVDFSFATSVVSTYAAGLPASTAVMKATLSSINTNCVLDVSTLVVSGSESGTITKSAGIGSTNAEGQVLFEIAVPASEAAASDRSVVFTTSGKAYTASFSGKAITSGKAYSAMSENHSVEDVVLGKTSTIVFIGSPEILTATVYPAKSNQELTWTSSSDAIATVDQTGKVTGVALGTATITATSKDDSSIKATCTVTVDLAYVTIGGKKWATKNLGATTIAGSLATCAGDYYQWGSVNTLYEHITWSGSSGTFSFKDGKESGFVSGNREYTGNDAHLPDSRDVVKKKVGNGWRMPKKEDFVALYNACGGTSTSGSPTALSSATPSQGIYWLAKDQSCIPYYTGVAGLLFVDDAGNTLFFPAAGLGLDTSLSNAGSYGYYWSSTLYSDNTDYASNLYFYSSNVNPQNCYYRYRGFSVRPVSD